jgi:hypothetical protein
MSQQQNRLCTRSLARAETRLENVATFTVTVQFHTTCARSNRVRGYGYTGVNSGFVI